MGNSVPEREVRHFVLPVRVNNENLDSARYFFYEELAPRVRDLSMADAVLEVNHWCHEKAVYMPSDRRTSSPLATVKTAYGRCGEESTLLVAALSLSVFLPARSILQDGRTPTATMPGSRPGLTATGTFLVRASLSRCSISAGSTLQQAVEC